MKKTIQWIYLSIAFCLVLGIHQNVFADDYMLVSGGGTASASASATDVSPNNAFDSNAGTAWVSPSTTTFITQWLQYQLNSPMNTAIIEKYRIQAGLLLSPKAWNFQGSNNGTDWTTLDSQSNQINWADDEWREFTFTNSTAYMYYRIYITEVNPMHIFIPPYTDYWEYQIVITELELYCLDDSDGLPNSWEMTHFGNIYDYGPDDDPDNDGLSNLEEYTHQTDPNNPDTDGDGLLDGWEVENGLDPLVPEHNFDLDSEDYLMISTEGTASASASWPDDPPYTYGPDNAFDSNETTAWASPDAQTDFIPQWLQYQLSSQMGAISVNKYRIQASIYNSPKSWNFQGSNNGTDWTTLDTQTNQTNWVDHEWREFTFTNSTAYSYYRIYITDVNHFYYVEPPYIEFRFYHITIIEVELRYNDLDDLPNWWELIHFPDIDGQGPNNDSDGDDLSNLLEYQNQTDPLDSDTDNDVMTDGWEVVSGLSPTSNDAFSDPDNDGLSNLSEYENDTDPLDSDTDNDGMPDGWEVEYGLNPLVNDASVDSDNDGLSNLQEYQNQTDPLIPDTDNDDDGLVDSWELNYFGNLSQDRNGDYDGDGFTNYQEYIANTNPADSGNKPGGAVYFFNYDNNGNLKDMDKQP